RLEARVVAVHVVEVHTHLARKAALPGVRTAALDLLVRVLVTEEGALADDHRGLFVTPRAPRMSIAGDRSVRTAQPGGLAVRAAAGGILRRRRRRRRAPTTATPEGELRRRNTGRIRIDELLPQWVVGPAGRVALDLVAPVGGMHHLVDLVL